MMTPNTLRRIGLQLNNGRDYGWQQKIADVAMVTDRSVRRWYAGDAPIPPLAEDRIRSRDKKPKKRGKRK